MAFKKSIAVLASAAVTVASTNIAAAQLLDQIEVGREQAVNIAVFASFLAAVTILTIYFLKRRSEKNFRRKISLK